MKFPLRREIENLGSGTLAISPTSGAPLRMVNIKLCRSLWTVKNFVWTASISTFFTVIFLPNRVTEFLATLHTVIHKSKKLKKIYLPVSRKWGAGKNKTFCCYVAGEIRKLPPCVNIPPWARDSHHAYSDKLSQTTRPLNFPLLSNNTGGLRGCSLRVQTSFNLMLYNWNLRMQSAVSCRGTISV